MHLGQPDFLKAGLCSKGTLKMGQEETHWPRELQFQNLPETLTSPVPALQEEMGEDQLLGGP